MILSDLNSIFLWNLANLKCSLAWGHGNSSPGLLYEDVESY